MTIKTKFDIKDKVFAIVIEKDGTFNIKERVITDMKLITGSVPFIVYKLMNVEKLYNEGQLFETREAITSALVEQVKIIGSSSSSMYLGQFLEIHGSH